jgi:small subunit ribosomal protein S1
MEYLKFIPEGWVENKADYEIDNIKDAFCNGKIMQGFVYKCDSNYNLHVKLGENLTGIIPRNEVDYMDSDEYGFTRPSICKNKINSYVQFKVKEIYSDNQIILSRKKANAEAIEWMKENLKPNQVVKGIVKNIRKYGVFVEIGAGVTGLLHIEDISVSRIKSPEERFFSGQKIDVMIKSIDKETGRIVLSYKELFGTWDENVEALKEGSIVKGIIKESDKFKNGLFIELKPNLVGMAEFKEGFSYGQNVNVYIKKIIPDKKKIKLIIV